MAHFSGGCVVLAASVVLLAQGARADGFGWVWYSGGPKTSRHTTHNSSGGAVTIAQTETGFYTVTFAGLGGAPANNGVAVVSAFQSNATCQVGTIAPVGADMAVQVDCWGPQGGQVNTYFSLSYDQHTIPTADGRSAYVYDSSPSAIIGTAFAADPSGSYNATGGFNTITHTAVGAYTVTMPGLVNFGGTVQVSAGGFEDAAQGGFSARCQVVDWAVQAGATVAAVSCVDGTAQPVDTYFRLLYLKGDTADQRPVHTGITYAWANRPNSRATYTPKPAYQFDSFATSGQLGASLVARYPRYLVLLPPGKYVTSTLAVTTAHNLPGSYCNVFEWSTNYVYVECYDATGKPVRGQFDLLFDAAF